MNCGNCRHIIMYKTHKVCVLWKYKMQYLVVSPINASFCDFDLQLQFRFKVYMHSHNFQARPYLFLVYTL